MTTSIRLSSVTINCPDTHELARFYADIADGTITFEHEEFATVRTPGGRIDVQRVQGHRPPTWPGPGGDPLVHLDFLVEDLDAAGERVQAAGATRCAHQPNAEHCLVFADPAGNPFCLTLLDELE